MERIVKAGDYPTPEAAVADALAVLEDSADLELDAWLKGVVAERYDAHATDPTKAISLEDARKRLLGGA
ncbi:MAG: hypothetical protein ABWZ40_01125 [Caulobacterales bacterium]